MITTLVDIIALSECNEDDAVLKIKLTMHGYKKNMAPYLDRP